MHKGGKTNERVCVEEGGDLGGDRRKYGTGEGGRARGERYNSRGGGGGVAAD